MGRKAIAALVVAMVCLGAIALSPTAFAYDEDHFCGAVVSPGASCGGDMPTLNWRKVRSRYPGAQAHNVTACVYMWNFTTNQTRGLAVWCDYSWNEQPIGHDFGPTGQNSYRSYNQLPGSMSPHTLVGWTCRDC